MTKLKTVSIMRMINDGEKMKISHIDSYSITLRLNAVEDHSGKDAFETYNFSLTHEMITLLSEQTELYAVRDKNIPNFRVDVECRRNGKLFGLN